MTPSTPDPIALLEALLATTTDPAQRAKLEVAIAAMRGQPTPAENNLTARDINAENVVVGNFYKLVIQKMFPAADHSGHEKLLARYLHTVVTECARLNLKTIDPAANPARRQPLSLNDVYVDLKLAHPIGKKHKSLAAHHKWLAAGGTMRQDAKDAMGKRDATRLPLAAEALACHPRVTLIGKPGSGKSTVGAHVMLALAQAAQGNDAALTALGPGWTHGALLPIRIVLRRFAETLPANCADATAGDLWKFISATLVEQHTLPAHAGEVLKQIAFERGAWFFLDGLDECGDEHRRRAVLAGVEDFVSKAGPKCRILITARPYAWESALDAAYGEYALADFDNEQIEAYISRWYAALVMRGWLGEAEAETKRDSLLVGVRQRDDLQPITSNPLLLTLTAVVHFTIGQLPDDRVLLYDEVVTLMLRRWNEPVGASKALLSALDNPGIRLESIRGVIEKLAYEAHAANVGQQGAADLSEDVLRRAFYGLTRDYNKAELIVRYIFERAGLMLDQGLRGGVRWFTFPHRTFQEYLAACHLASQDGLGEHCYTLANAAPAHWQEVLPMAARVAGKERGIAAADAMIGSCAPDVKQLPSDADWLRAILAAEQLREIGLTDVHSSKQGVAVCERISNWLVALLAACPLKAVQRVRAGNLLALLGDPRFSKDRWWLPADDTWGFIHIPAGPYRIGTHPDGFERVMKIAGVPEAEHHYSKNEKNIKSCDVDTFHIATFPVTVAQWRVYVEEMKRSNSTFTIRNSYNLEGTATCPVRYVNWHEAMQYCAWLTQRLHVSTIAAHMDKIYPRGWQVTLPSELEWEKVARGGGATSAVIWPWGDAADADRANFAETGIDTVSPVGCFANGAPTNGCQDMIGNVWEWMRNKYADYPYIADDGRETLDDSGDNRALRGGAFNFNLRDARVSHRVRNHPGDSYSNAGFRVVVRACSS
jgi:formylglycine-generating enzyme required for sulfatase activity